MAQDEPTIAGILQELSTQYHGVVAEREVMDRVLERKPSRAKNPYAGIREKLRYDGPRLGWVRLGGGELIPLRVALTGLRFRVILSDDEYASDQDRLEQARAICRAGPPRPPPRGCWRQAAAHRRAMTCRRSSLGDWLSQVGFLPGDSIFMTIRAAQPLVLRLEHELAAAFRAQDVSAHRITSWSRRSPNSWPAGARICCSPRRRCCRSMRARPGATATPASPGSG